MVTPGIFAGDEFIEGHTRQRITTNRARRELVRVFAVVHGCLAVRFFFGASAST
jgi:hypothetical protein